MPRNGILRRSVSTLVLAGALLAGQGCTYLRQRAEDGLEMVDIGISLSREPQLGLYWNSLDLFPFGVSEIDGTFVGWGGGQIGVTRHYNKCRGFGMARETIGWGEFDSDDPDTMYDRDAGLLGILLPPYESGPNYTPACVHFLPHIGYVGLVWNARYAEMLDFLLGWALLDIAGDDGYKVGRWSFPRRSEAGSERK